jgi:biotin carboxyl carrier protein
MKKFLVVHDGAEKLVEVAPLRANLFRVIMDGAAHEVDVRQCTSDSISMLLDNKASDFSYAFLNDRLELHGRTETYSFEVLDERKMMARRARRNREEQGPETVKAIMPGKVIHIRVKPGDTVAAGDGLLIMEAMKMENEIKCRRPGTVRAVHVVPGQAVENGTLLLEIE